jgi:hypothetical protein
MTSLSVDLRTKWGKIRETSEELAGILMFLFPQLQVLLIFHKINMPMIFKKNLV